MTPQDRIRLGTLIGTPHPELFTPDTDSGDNGLLAQWLLSAGWSIHISLYSGGIYHCTLGRTSGDDDISAEAPSRREALALCALGLCE